MPSKTSVSYTCLFSKNDKTANRISKNFLPSVFSCLRRQRVQYTKKASKAVTSFVRSVALASAPEDITKSKPRLVCKRYVK